MRCANCNAGRDSANGSSMAGNALRIHRPRVRTRSSGILFPRSRSAANNHRRRSARSASASEKATRAAYANPRFPAQARFGGDHSRRRSSDHSSVANAALIAAQFCSCERVLVFGFRVNSSESGGPERSRTSDNLVRSQVLYPAELQARRNNACVPTRLRYPACDFNSARKMKFASAPAASSAAPLVL
jgi:hypothetical protein